MRILLITPDLNLRDVFGRSLPLGWVLDVVRTAEEAAASVDTQKPDLVVADMILAGMNGLAFLQALHKRTDWPPATVLVTQSAVDETLHGVALGLKVQEVLSKPVDEEAVQRIYAPYQLDDGPLHMSLLEFLVTGYTDMSNRQLDLMAGGHRISLIFGMGYLWAIRHPLFGDRYRNALSAAGLRPTPPKGEDDLLDEAAVEERLGPSPQLSALKQHTVLSILASIPLHLTFQGRIADVIIPEGLLPLDVPSVVVPLVERVPESALSALRTPGLRVGPSPDVIPADLPIQPQQGFILSLCNGMVPVQQLVHGLGSALYLIKNNQGIFWLDYQSRFCLHTCDNSFNIKVSGKKVCQTLVLFKIQINSLGIFSSAKFLHQPCFPNLSGATNNQRLPPW